MLENHRHQHTVGQGLFHAGSVLEAGATRLSYVYDCGAMDSYAGERDREIRRYLSRARPAKRPLDILFLSHVHADHVNGVPLLLAKRGGVKVDTIVLPLVDAVDRLIAFARTLSADAASAHEVFYQQFVIDPVAALSDFDPRQIIFIRSGNDGGAPGGDEEPLPRLDGPNLGGPSDEKTDSSWKLIGTGYVKEVSPSEPGLHGVRQYVVPDTAAIGVFARSAATDAGTAVWLLAPYVDTTVVAARAAFLRRLARRLKIKVSLIENWLTNKSNLQMLVTSGLSHLAAAYSAVTQNFNITSLALYSGPARGLTRALPRGRSGLFGLVSGVTTTQPAWLGTGDAALKERKRRNAFVNHYGSLLTEVGTLLLPHHGSDHNFHHDLLLAVNPSVCIASADKYSNWKHPGPHTIQAVCSHPAVIQVVTSKQRSRVHEVAFVG